MNATAAIFDDLTALSDATRSRMLLILERHELTVVDLCGVLQLPQSTVSRHLKVLADDGWVTARPDGTSRLYRMTLEVLDPAARRLWALLRAGEDGSLEFVIAQGIGLAEIEVGTVSGTRIELQSTLVGRAPTAPTIG